MQQPIKTAKELIILIENISIIIIKEMKIIEKRFSNVTNRFYS